MRLIPIFRFAVDDASLIKITFPFSESAQVCRCRQSFRDVLEPGIVGLCRYNRCSIWSFAIIASESAKRHECNDEEARHFLSLSRSNQYALPRKARGRPRLFELPKGQIPSIGIGQNDSLSVDARQWRKMPLAAGSSKGSDDCVFPHDIVERTQVECWLDWYRELGRSL
jgi:hypothetical protein